MFKPENDKLKTIVFHLLKKKPNYYYTPFCCPTVIVWDINNNDVKETVSINIPALRDLKWSFVLHINAKEVSKDYIVHVTEREAMEIKWALENFVDELDEDGLNKVAEFALEEQGTMDELIED